MDEMIKKSHEENIPLFYATEYECRKARQRATELGIEIPVPLHARSVHQDSRVLLGKPAEVLLEELFMIKVRGSL